MDLVTLNELKYWIKERENIRLAKESGRPKPWSKDPIFQQYKFCNVHREDDFVTRWFSHNWRAEKYWDEPNFIAAIILGRTINWPPTLDKIGFPHEWNMVGILSTMDQMKDRGEKVYTGAYMITAGPTGVRKNLWVLNNAKSYFKDPPKLDPTSIQNSWEIIIDNGYPCVGPFIAGQIIADLKQTKYLESADDWWHWAPLGPGSARGLNRVMGRRVGQAITQSRAVREMLEVRDALKLDEPLCLQDVQNCLCELDKYMRVKLNQGKPRSSYPGLPY
jgi:hypothetical protein